MSQVYNAVIHNFKRLYSTYTVLTVFLVLYNGVFYLNYDLIRDIFFVC